MPLWNNNNREESKPAWLNKTEKRHTVRTIRGWEMPLMGSLFGYGVTNGNAFGGGAGVTFATVQTEVIVTLPNDPSTAGVTSSNYAYGPTGLYGVGRMDGLTFGSEQQYTPYFTAPCNGDSATAGTPITGVTGVSHAYLTYVPGFDSNGYPSTWVGATAPKAGIGYQYGVNAYGVSTLGGLTGVTAYIKIQANDTNLTQNLTIGLSGTYSGMALYTGVGLTPGGTLSSNQIPTDVYKVFFGPTGDKNGRVAYRQDNIAVLVIGGATANGNKVVDITVRDNSGSNAVGVNGITGATGYARFTLMFDRPAGLTTAGLASAAIPTDYTWAKDNTIRI